MGAEVEMIILAVQQIYIWELCYENAFIENLRGVFNLGLRTFKFTSHSLASIHKHAFSLIAIGYFHRVANI